MSTNFFTNENENTLINKIEGIFKHRNIHFFDALVTVQPIFNIKEFKPEIIISESFNN